MFEQQDGVSCHRLTRSVVDRLYLIGEEGVLLADTLLHGGDSVVFNGHGHPGGTTDGNAFHLDKFYEGLENRGNYQNLRFQGTLSDLPVNGSDKQKGRTGEKDSDAGNGVIAPRALCAIRVCVGYRRGMGDPQSGGHGALSERALCPRYGHSPDGIRRGDKEYRPQSSVPMWPLA